MTDARDVIASTRLLAYATAEAHWPIKGRPFCSCGKLATAPHLADELLVALAAAGLSITEIPDEWEYGARWDDEDWTVEKPTEAHARAYVGQKCIHGGPITVVRRRPAGPWEVAP